VWRPASLIGVFDAAGIKWSITGALHIPVHGVQSFRHIVNANSGAT
jgi:hypothetical protein